MATSEKFGVPSDRTLKGFFVNQSPWITVPTIVLVSVSGSVGMLYLLVALLKQDYGSTFGRPLFIAIAVPALVSAPVGGYIISLLREVDHARRRAQELAWIDGLTGLMNRRRMVELGEREFEIARRTSRDVTVALIDLDDFKRINDSHGHRSGDIVICEVARAAKAQLRRADLMGRWGGEEFLVVLPDTNLESARIVAERIRSAIEALDIDVGSSQRVGCTVSIGLSALEPGVSFGAWVDQADTTMYAAKAGGKNMVRWWIKTP